MKYHTRKICYVNRKSFSIHRTTSDHVFCCSLHDSMAFSLTYQSILDHNIRHIYSGKPAEVSYHHSPQVTRNSGAVRQTQENPLKRSYILRTSEFESRFHCFVPRAPAFRVLSRHEVDNIVGRLQSAKTTSPETKDSSKGQLRKSKTVSSEELKNIVERLRKPTQMSIIRERPPQHLAFMPEIA